MFLECAKEGYFYRGIMHDMSKFMPDEFIPYARYFYGNYENPEMYPLKLIVDYEFDLAWLKHQHRNPHHWQYWLLKEDSGKLKIMEMKDEYVIEMLCDWKGAGRAINRINNPNECKNWYLDSYSIILLAEKTRRMVDRKLNTI